MKVVVTGARGLLGGEIVRRFGEAGYSVAGWSSGQHDGYRQVNVLRRQESVRALDDDRPDVLVHCAANPSVGACEADPAAARELNADAVRVLAGLAAERSIRFVHISSDYVFSGDNPNGYEEADEPDPLQVYGQTKADAERYCRDVPGALVVRMPLLFGVGHAVPRATFPEQVVQSLRAGKEITADAVEVRQPTYTADVALVLRQLTDASTTGIVHVAAQQAITKYDWAVSIADLTGLDASLIQPGRPAANSKRPVRSWLRVRRLAELGIAPPRPVADTTPEFLRAASLLLT